MEPEPSITCVDCLGTAHLLSHAPHEGWEPGDVVAYVCPDCWERFDLILPDTESDDAG